jgi:hypothetical protein
MCVQRIADVSTMGCVLRNGDVAVLNRNPAQSILALLSSNYSDKKAVLRGIKLSLTIMLSNAEPWSGPRLHGDGRLMN